MRFLRYMTFLYPPECQQLGEKAEDPWLQRSLLRRWVTDVVTSQIGNHTRVLRHLVRHRRSYSNHTYSLPVPPCPLSHTKKNGHGEIPTLCLRCSVDFDSAGWHSAVNWVFVRQVLSICIAAGAHDCIYRPQTSTIADPTLRSVAERFLGVGETVFDMAQGSAVNSSYFKRESNR
jgi:hypothetical protein